ncbi:hypothetical protein U9M48_001040 [Paspalum notatum var. saurae]|uniref:Transposase Tnp1/En/Spm-like domain-containing protein n=1 Tax=Paspalum notatum var. saurae TaxID=547442 RepID=A0AAQ3PL93_PASNO
MNKADESLTKGKISSGPNGEKRNIVGAFGISNLLELEGGKVMVGTDENGVPNERSASILGQYLGSLAESQTFAPLHIARWDNKLFKTYKEQIIKDVEDESFEELKKRKEHNNGNLSSKDFNEVFNDVVATQLEARGYYGDKYWSQVKVSKGITFVNQSEEDKMYQDKVNAMENKMQHMSGVMKQWFAFMTRKFPEEDWLNEMGTEVNEVDHINTEENYREDINDVCDSEIHMNNDSNDDVTSPNHMQGAHVQDINRDSENFCQTSIHAEQTIGKEAHTEKHGPVENGSTGATLPPDSTMTSMGTRRVKAPEQNGQASQREVYLLSMMYKGRFVAKGKLVTTDSKRVIGESMLGSEFVGVYVDALVNAAYGNNGEEELPRPLYEVKTLRDAIDYVIAWPRSHVKIRKTSAETQKKMT